MEESDQERLEDFGKIDILVNNAGITADQLVNENVRRGMGSRPRSQFKSCYNTCRAVVRSMMKAKKGKIINISSVVGLNGNAGQVNYAASKAGMIGFTKALAKEVASRQYPCQLHCPGFYQERK